MTCFWLSAYFSLKFIKKVNISNFFTLYFLFENFVINDLFLFLLCQLFNIVKAIFMFLHKIVHVVTLCVEFLHMHILFMSYFATFLLFSFNKFLISSISDLIVVMCFSTKFNLFASESAKSISILVKQKWHLKFFLVDDLLK